MPFTMRRYLIIGLVVFVFFLLRNFPAQLALHWFAPEGVTVYGVEGTVWNGRAQALGAGPLLLGETSWDLSLSRLLTATLSADVKSHLGDSRVNANISRSLFGDALELTGLQGIVYLQDLPAALLQQDIDGRLGLSFDTLHLVDGWPSQARGSVDLVDLDWTTQFGSATLGSFELIFAGEPDDAGTLNGQLGDTDSPIALEGTLRLAANRSYKIDAIASARPGAPAEIADALKFLGQPVAGGGTRIEFAGVIE